MSISENPNPKYKPIVVDNLFAWQYTSSGKIAEGASTGNKGDFDFNILYRVFFTKKKPPYSKIKPNSGKVQIKWLQKNLNICCQAILDGKADKLIIDGIWGKKTWAALRAYWKQLGWRTTGSYAGKKTCSALWKGRTGPS